MAERTTGPQKAMRPVSLRASLRLDVSRAAPSSKAGMRDVSSRANRWLSESFHASLNERLRHAHARQLAPVLCDSLRDVVDFSLRGDDVRPCARGRACGARLG